MKFFTLIILVFAVLFFSACRKLLPLPANESEDLVKTSLSETTMAPLPYDISVEGPSPLVLEPGAMVPLRARVTLTDGSVIPHAFSSVMIPGSSEPELVQWSTDNPDVVAFAPGGVVRGLTTGQAKVYVSLANQTDFVEVTVVEPQVADVIPATTPPPPAVSELPAPPEGSVTVVPKVEPKQDEPAPPLVTEQPAVTPPPPNNPEASELSPPPVPPEPTPPPDVPPPAQEAEAPKPTVVEAPADFSDRFLGPNDELTISYGENGGFGSHLFPEIVYGMPQTGGKDVVSLGGGGSLLIKLHGYLAADGPGPDFTIFENPVYSKKLNVVFAERAQVSVSQDGAKFYDYPCDVNNAADLYPGCAGVGEVFALQDPTNPKVSGGDHYDLAAFGLPWIQYIRIQDLDTCQPGDPTYETQQVKFLCKGPGVQGLDLDAVAIVNGVREKTVNQE